MKTPAVVLTPPGSDPHLEVAHPAVALAVGQVWLATGSDLGGSLRTPASFCGVVGLRPSPGRVAHGPKTDAFDTLSVEGPMARNVGDLALMLDAMTGAAAGDPLALPPSERAFSAAVAARSAGCSYAFDEMFVYGSTLSGIVSGISHGD